MFLASYLDNDKKLKFFFYKQEIFLQIFSPQ